MIIVHDDQQAMKIIFSQDKQTTDIVNCPILVCLQESKIPRRDYLIEQVIKLVVCHHIDIDFKIRGLHKEKMLLQQQGNNLL